MDKPLALRMRPQRLEDVLGQEDIIGENKLLNKLVDNKKLFSIIFYGKPGTGKTTIATILAKSMNLKYRMLNATSCSKKDLESAIYEAKLDNGMVLIVDEVHRLNTDKQDILLPAMENGDIILLGATTSNPFHSINNAIRSRAQLIEIKPLDSNNIVIALKRAIKSPNGLNDSIKYDEEALQTLANLSSGDLRYALNKLEILSTICDECYLNKQVVINNIQKANTFLDKDEDGHYDSVSALQKSIRGSDVDAALYYAARLIAYEDLDSLERRLLVTAYEDIGLANPQAVDRTINALNAARQVGFPEAAIPIGFCIIDLALSPKSKSAANAIHKAIDIVNQKEFPIPEYLKLTPINLNNEEKYDYDNPEIWNKIQYLPNLIRDIKFYEPNYQSGPYELSLIKNYENLKKIYRSSNLANLKNNYKSNIKK